MRLIDGDAVLNHMNKINISDKSDDFVTALNKVVMIIDSMPTAYFTSDKKPCVHFVPHDKDKAWKKYAEEIMKDMENAAINHIESY